MKKFMKKIFLLCSILLGSTCYAQNTGLGFTGASGVSWISGTGLKTSPAPSLNIGATLVFLTDAQLGFSADVVFSNEGVNYTKDYFGTTTNTRFNSEYIRVPLRVTYFFNKYHSRIRPSIAVGPSLGFLTGGKIMTDHPNGQVQRQYVNDVLKPFDVGVQGALGLSFNLGQDLWFNTYISYYQGLLKQNKEGDENMKNGHLLLNASVTFGLNRK